MGLDAVELVIAAEEEFDLQIPDAAAGEMQYVGDMHAFILNTLRERHGAEAVDEQDIWQRVKQIVVEQLGVNPESVTPTAHFIRDLNLS